MRFTQQIRRKMVNEGADAAERLVAGEEAVYTVPTNDPYLAQSIAVVLRNRGYRARAEGHTVRISPV